jgi:hypothetical protein
MQNITFHYKPNNFGSLILKHKEHRSNNCIRISARWVYGQLQKAHYPITHLGPVILPPIIFPSNSELHAKTKLQEKNSLAILCQRLSKCATCLKNCSTDYKYHTAVHVTTDW